MRQESYQAFDFLPAIKPRAHGGLYEFRTYWLKPGGLPITVAAWQAALEPAKAYTDHLVTNMVALDGPYVSRTSGALNPYSSVSTCGQRTMRQGCVRPAAHLNRLSVPRP